MAMFCCLQIREQDKKKLHSCSVKLECVRVCVLEPKSRLDANTFGLKYGCHILLEK
jgi:hypothetical protein